MRVTILGKYRHHTEKSLKGFFCAYIVLVVFALVTVLFTDLSYFLGVAPDIGYVFAMAGIIYFLKGVVIPVSIRSTGVIFFCITWCALWIPGKQAFQKSWDALNNRKVFQVYYSQKEIFEYLKNAKAPVLTNATMARFYGVYNEFQELKLFTDFRYVQNVSPGEHVLVNNDDRACAQIDRGHNLYPNYVRNPEQFGGVVIHQWETNGTKLYQFP